MSFLRAASLVVGTLMVVGCQGGHGTPNASSPGPRDEQINADVARSWKASHPGSDVGVVNAVLLGRRALSVDGLPVDAIHPGDIVTILLNDQGTSTIEAVVQGTNAGPSGKRYVQLTYSEPGMAQRNPRSGDLAIWYPGGPAVPTSPTEATTQVAPLPATTEPVVPETTAPPSQTEPAPASQPAPPAENPAQTKPTNPAEAPADNTTSQPAAPTQPTTTETPANGATSAPDNSTDNNAPKPDLNK